MTLISVEGTRRIPRGLHTTANSRRSLAPSTEIDIIVNIAYFREPFFLICKQINENNLIMATTSMTNIYIHCIDIDIVEVYHKY
jgi:predicted double-glycine peptidase